MAGLRLLTAGESHGPQLTAVLDGCPAGLTLTAADIDHDLARRQSGHGRGERQAIERDRVRILGGVRHGRTTGAPIALVIENRDAANWGAVVAAEPLPEGAAAPEPVRVPRPGHADLGGALLYGHDDLRPVIERASARETAARVACGAVARRLLAAVGCTVASHVVAIGDVAVEGVGLGVADVARVEESPVRCLDPEASRRMCAAIDAAAAAGDTLGGVVEVVAFGFPPGVGTYVQGDRRLGARLAAAAMSVPAIKGVEIGLGFGAARRRGSEVHDPIVWQDGEYRRPQNHAGGVEGGISTGEPVVLRAAMKPIATLRRPLPTVELGSHRPVESRYERADVCAVPAAGVVLEAAVALALADALLDRFPAATVDELVAAVTAFRERCRRR